MLVHKDCYICQHKKPVIWGEIDDGREENVYFSYLRCNECYDRAYINDGLGNRMVWLGTLLIRVEKESPTLEEIFYGKKEQ